jgi:hypothetical protein
LIICYISIPSLYFDENVYSGQKNKSLEHNDSNLLKMYIFLIFYINTPVSLFLKICRILYPYVSMHHRFLKLKFLMSFFCNFIIFNHLTSSCCISLHLNILKYKNLIERPKLDDFKMGTNFINKQK